ncbi:MAG: 2Fe-2S iron-sulfur cluster-binding protein, partial [Dehalococcoidia bacterium]|nr:2Fe-2S iron-sulfur cluster-binding protein [Dehalococcoidia bacterium]
MRQQSKDNHAGTADAHVHVDFEPVGRRDELPRGLTLLECAHRLGVGLSAVCGGHGTCGRCRVQLVDGALTPPTALEQSLFSEAELGQGLRLACQAVPASDCVIHVPPESLTATQRVQVEGLQVTPAADPPVVGRRVAVSAPSMRDVAGDSDRVLAALNAGAEGACETVDLLAVRSVSSELRANDWMVEASIRGKELIAVGPWPSPTLGLAVDVGTTKIAAYLVDLTTGATLAARGAMNPQIRFGEDVITRLSYALTHAGGAAELSSAVIQGINGLVSELTAEVKADPQRILECVIAGNTAMHHLLLQLPVAPLSRAPY